MAQKLPPSTMRAWQYSSTKGGIEKNLKINTFAQVPKLKPNQHLVEVIAAALNPVDYKPIELPVVGRFLISKPGTPCVDFVGRIVKLAEGSDLKVGQLVFGVSGNNPLAGGALAEYNLASDSSIVAVPDGVDPIYAATIGVAGLTAYQSIVPRVKKGDKIFINGGSGGTGVFGIQIAKIVGCHVTTTCSTRNVELCKSLGADVVLDYTKGNVFQALKASNVSFDHAVDNVGSNEELVWKCHELMKPGAAYVKVAGDITWGGLIDSTKRKFWPGSLGGIKGNLEGFWPKPAVEDLSQLAEWMKEGRMKAVIDESFSFESAPKAFEKLKTGRARGKVVVKVIEG